MVDIHSHIIPNVDDGSKSIEASIKILSEEIKQGVTNVICTPHYRRHMFETESEEIKLSFIKLQEYVKNLNLNINIFLGQELYCRSIESFHKTLDYLDIGKVLTFNGGKYILLEFSYTEEIDIAEIAYSAICRGYKPIIAHIERYQYITSIEQIEEIKEVGALIQINASSIIGKDGRRAKKFINTLIKAKLVDFVSSDIHESRTNYLLLAYNYVCKKYSVDIANQIFNENGLKLIKEFEADAKNFNVKEAI